MDKKKLLQIIQYKINSKSENLEKMSRGEFKTLNFFQVLYRALFSPIFLVAKCLTSRSYESFKNCIVSDHAIRVIDGHLQKISGNKVKYDIGKVGLVQIHQSLWQNLYLWIILPSRFSRLRPELFHWLLSFLRSVIKYEAVLLKGTKIDTVLACVTNDADRLALGYVANRRELKCFLFHVAKMEVHAHGYPIDSTAEFARTKSQMENLVSKGKDVYLAEKDEERMDLTFSKQRIAFAFGAKFHVEKAFELIKKYAECFPEFDIVVRLHPGRSETLAPFFAPFKVSYKEKYVEFVKGVDFVVCSNTNAIIDSVSCGIPAVYLSGFDPFVDDLLGFVERGLVMRSRTDGLVELEDIRKFYSSETFTQARSAIINTDNIYDDSVSFIKDKILKCE